MTKTKYISRKIIKLIVFVILYVVFSCSSVRINKANYLANSLDNYIKSYETYNFEETLDFIMISVKEPDGKIEYIINDAPREILLGDLIKKKENNNTSEFFGYYKGFVCKIQADSLQNYKHLFKKLDDALITEAEKSRTVKGNDGKEYKLDLSLQNWTPELIIIFDKSSNSREIVLND